MQIGDKITIGDKVTLFLEVEATVVGHLGEDKLLVTSHDTWPTIDDPQICVEPHAVVDWERA